MSMPEILKRRLIETAVAIAAGAAGVVAYKEAEKPSPAVLLAMEVGSYYESSGRHIGTPYIDNAGKGRPLTVCNGITGKDVVAGKYYTPDDCKRLELPHYLKAEREAKAALKHWATYNPYIQASFIDAYFNMGASTVNAGSIPALANSGALGLACQKMTEYVLGTVNGQKVRLRGLVDRRGASAELCSEWGRDGHFSAGLITAEAKP